MINVMGDLVNQNIVQVKPAKMIKSVTVGQIERMGTNENTRIPVNAVTPQAAGPRFLLLAGPGQQEHCAQSLARGGGHALKARPYFGTTAGVDEIGNLWSQHDDVRKRRNAGDSAIKAFERGACLREERVVGRRIGELGPAVSVAPRTG